jgi:CTP:phosphocholine cytidylyltransferase-like protein
MKKYLVVMTPKAAANFSKENFEYLRDKEITIVESNDIYLNMLEGWTEEECDAVAYIVSEDTWNNTNFNQLPPPQPKKQRTFH